MSTFYEDHGCCEFCYYVGVETPEDEELCACAEYSSKCNLHDNHVYEWDLECATQRLLGTSNA